MQLHTITGEEAQTIYDELTYEYRWVLGNLTLEVNIVIPAHADTHQDSQTCIKRSPLEQNKVAL
jgi:hypothetical protein